MKNKVNKALDKQWIYELPPFNTEKQTIDDMSLIVGMYGNYIVTRTGYLVGIIETSGINVDLLSDTEQTDVFDSYNTFLISQTSSQPGEDNQFVELTIPVDMEEYIFNLKVKYVEAMSASKPNMYLINLIASYIDYYSNLQSRQSMSTKKHLIIVRTKIKSRHVEDLEIARSMLNEKIDSTMRSINASLIDTDIVSDVLAANDVLYVLKTFINFKS